MTDRPLQRAFYERDPHAVARDLLGHDLVREFSDGTTLRGRIVETEVYGGIVDPASHSSSGVPTERTQAMFGQPGTAYVYQIYGMYHCLNVVTPAEARPSAILLRALEPIEGLDWMAQRRGLYDRYDQAMPAKIEKNLLSGPGKLCQAMGIDARFDGVDLSDGALRVVAGQPVDDERIGATPRIGLNPKTVGEAVDWPWRYVVTDSTYLSRPYGA